MKKKIILFLFVFIICIGIVGIICYKINNNKEQDFIIEELKNVGNISDQYSTVKVKDYETAKESLKDVLNYLKIKDIDKELVADKIDTTGNYINTYKFSQLYNGIEVYNAGLIIYTDKSGNTKGIINNIKEINNLEVSQQSDLADLELKVKEEYSENYKNIENHKNIIYMLDNGTFTLAHKYTVKFNDEVFNEETIILQDGTNEIIQKGSIIYELEKDDYDNFLMDNKYDLADLKRNIFLIKQERGKLDEKNSLNGQTYTWNKNEEISKESELLTKAICTTQKCYDYFENKFSYISFNGTDNSEGIRLITNIKQYYGKDKSNTILSLPSSSAIIIGSDNNYNDNIECIGHEYTHCIFYNRTGNEGKSSLENQALNEAYSDIMGMCIEAYYNGNTSIDGYISANDSRDIKNSNAKYEELNKIFKKDKYYYSMIISKAAYLMNQKIPLDKVEQLWFESMKLLNKDANFNDCYYAIIEMANIMNFSDNEMKIIKDSFAEVGIKTEILDYMKTEIANSWNERNDNKIDDTNIVGEWKATKTSNDNYSLGYIYGTSIRTNNNLKLNDNGTYTLYLGFTFSQEGNYQINGTTINLIDNKFIGDSPDYKIAQQLKINGTQLILEEKADNNSSVNIIFENVNASVNDNTATTTQTSSQNNLKDFNVGSASIKYGTYNGEAGATGYTLVLKPEGTAILNGESYKFIIEKYDFAQDSSTEGSYKDAIVLKNSDGSTYFGLYVLNGKLCNDPMEFVYSNN